MLFPDFQSIGVPFKVILLVPLNSVGHLPEIRGNRIAVVTRRSRSDWFVQLGVSYDAGILPMRNAVLILVAFLLLPLAWSQSAKELAAVVGSWEGESKCTVADAPCHDEHVLLQISVDRKDPDQLNLDAYKVIDASPEFMGTLACRYRAKQSALSCTANTSQHDDWEFHIFGDAMTGKLMIDNGKTVYRRLAVHRAQAKGN